MWTDDCSSLVMFSGYDTHGDDIEGFHEFSHWKKIMPTNFNLRLFSYSCWVPCRIKLNAHYLRLAKQLVTFTQSGPYLNLPRANPSLLYVREGGYNGNSQFLTDSRGSVFMFLTSGCCVSSRLVDPQLAPTTRNTEQNYFKYIDIRPHTVEYERLCAVVGMTLRQKVVETTLIGGNAIRITTRSGKSGKFHTYTQFCPC